METDRERIQPETHALEAFIQATVQKLLSAGDAANTHGLLFLGNWHDAMPRLIFQDPVLQPVDTRIWGVIKIAAASGPTAFPTYKQIAALANVGSDATVARSMAILRATRWLSLCRRVRDTQGRFRGNVYALHDEPLPLADALYLDQEYMQFLEQAHTHGHPQVCKVAAAVMATIAEDLEAGRDVIATEGPLQRRLEAINAVERDGYRFFAFSSRQLQNLKSASETDSPQNLKSEPLQNLKSDGSSSYIYKNTTTTTEDTAAPRAPAREEPAIATLALPPSLSPNERHLAQLCLSKAPAANHQDVLDEFAGRMLAAKRKNRAIDNPIGYLARLCKAARKGKFTLTSLGLKTREGRHREGLTPVRPSDVAHGRVGDGGAITSTITPPDGGAITQEPVFERPTTMRPSKVGRQRALDDMRVALGVRDKGDRQRAPDTELASDGGAITSTVHHSDGAIFSDEQGEETRTPGVMQFRGDGGAITPGTGPPTHAAIPQQ